LKTLKKRHFWKKIFN